MQVRCSRISARRPEAERPTVGAVLEDGAAGAAGRRWAPRILSFVISAVTQFTLLLQSPRRHRPWRTLGTTLSCPAPGGTAAMTRTRCVRHTEQGHAACAQESYHEHRDQPRKGLRHS